MKNPEYLPEAFMVKGKDLKLNGSGIRRKYAMDIYLSALYLENKISDPLKVIHNNELMAIKLFVLSGLVTEKRMKEGLRECFDEAIKGKEEL